jgi:hypothetical protein
MQRGHNRRQVGVVTWRRAEGPLIELERVRVFANSEAGAQFYAGSMDDLSDIGMIDICPGAVLSWDGKPWTGAQYRESQCDTSRGKRPCLRAAYIQHGASTSRGKTPLCRWDRGARLSLSL